MGSSATQKLNVTNNPSPVIGATICRRAFVGPRVAPKTPTTSAWRFDRGINLPTATVSSKWADEAGPTEFRKAGLSFQNSRSRWADARAETMRFSSCEGAIIIFPSRCCKPLDRLRPFERVQRNIWEFIVINASRTPSVSKDFSAVAP